DHVVWLEEIIGFVAAAWLAERQQDLALGTELEDLMALRRRWVRTLRSRGGSRTASTGRGSATARASGAATARPATCGRACGATATRTAPSRGAAARTTTARRTRGVVLAVGDPDVAIAINVDAM